MSLAAVQRFIHNNSSRLPCDGLTLNCYVFSKMQLVAYRICTTDANMDTIEVLKTQVPNLIPTSGTLTFTLEKGGRSSKQAKPTDLLQVAKIHPKKVPRKKNIKAHGLAVGGKNPKIKKSPENKKYKGARTCRRWQKIPKSHEKKLRRTDLPQVVTMPCWFDITSLLSMITLRVVDALSLYCNF